MQRNILKEPTEETGKKCCLCHSYQTATEAHILASEHCMNFNNADNVVQHNTAVQKMIARQRVH